jgi:hypothetical protein
METQIKEYLIREKGFEELKENIYSDIDDSLEIEIKPNYIFDGMYFCEVRNVETSSFVVFSFMFSTFGNFKGNFENLICELI